MRLEIVPRLEEGVSLRRHGIVEQRKVNGEAIIEGCGEQIGCHQSTAPQISHYLLGQSPLGPNDLVPATERVRHHLAGPHDELGYKVDLMRLRPTEKDLSLLVEGRGKRTPLATQVCQSRGVVSKDTHCATPQRRSEVAQPEANHLQLPEIDRETYLLPRPLARNEAIEEVHTRPVVQGVGPKEDVRLGGARDTPQRPRKDDQLVHEVPLLVQKL